MMQTSPMHTPMHPDSTKLTIPTDTEIERRILFLSFFSYRHFWAVFITLASLPLLGLFSLKNRRLQRNLIVAFLYLKGA